MTDGFLRNIGAIKPTYAEKAMTDELATLSATPEGRRNDQLNVTALKLAKLPIDRDMLRGKLIGACNTNGLTDDGLHAVEATIDSAFQKADIDGPREVPQRKADPLAGITTADVMAQKDYGPLVMHVPGVVTGGYSILGGSPKVGKSWLVLDLALACAAGGLALGTVSVQPRHVLLMALEDGERRLTDRMRKLNHGTPKNLHIITDLQPGCTGIETVRAWLARHAQDTHPPLVIIDTLATIQPVVPSNSSNAYNVDYEFGRELKTAADSVPGAAVLAVHHNRKGDAADFIHKLSGSVGVTAACDCILALSRDRGSGHATLSVTGKDLEREDDYSLVRNGPLWEVNGADLDTAAELAHQQRAIGNLGERAGEILEIVNKRGLLGETTRAADCVEVVTKQQAGSYLSRLEESGRIQKITRGVYFPAGLKYGAESPDAGHGEP